MIESEADSKQSHAHVSSPAACTIISRNYLSHAKVLAKSYHKHCKNGRFYLLVVDGLPGDVVLDVEVEVLGPSELGIPYFFELCFKYNVTELSTAVKPSFLRHLLDARGEARVIYFDPDILIFNDLGVLRAALDGADIVLTPHVLRPIPLDGCRPNEQDILIAGAYNLGFLALRKSHAADALLCWWEERLRDGCRIDPSQGLMTDQKWVDLVPGFFPTTTLLGEETYNVAYWNLHERTVEHRERRFFVNGRPLSFFHFSGYDPTEPTVLSKHQNRTELIKGSGLYEIFELYTSLQFLNGYSKYVRLGYGYSHFDNGCTVHPILRQLYFELGDEERTRFGNLFHVNGEGSFFDWATLPQPENGGLSRFTAAIHRLRYDVAAAFPDPRDRDHDAFLKWARTEGALEMGYEPRLVRVAGDGAMAVLEHVGNNDPGEVGSSAVEVGADQPASGPRPFGMNVVGYLRNESGLGSAVRGYISALRSLDAPVSLKDLSELSVNRSEDRSLCQFDSVHPYDVNLYCVNADQHFVIMSHLGESFFRDHYNIGIWAWELPSFPAKWHDRFPYYDEIWVGTSFIANTLAPVAPVPIVRIPPVLTVPVVGDGARGRGRLGIRPDLFLFLFVFDFHSFFERKNPLGVIESFRRAFAPTDPVRLVIKCVNPDFDAESAARMNDRATGYPITILSDYLAADELRDLLAACDAYVSLHRSEGTGLTISEAMAIGKPVIATAWSGNMDFMNVSNSYPVRYELVELEKSVGPYQKGEIWADASVEHASFLMRHVFQNRGEAERVGRAAKREIETSFSEPAIARLIGCRLSVIADRRRFRELRHGLETGGVAPKYVDYQRQIILLRATLRNALPKDATVAVISKGDPELLVLDGRRAWHFPQTADGTYAGYYPADSATAIAHLESLRAKGADYLLIPGAALWWLEHYRDFRRHLDSCYNRVLHDEICNLYHLTPNRAQEQDGRIDSLFLQYDSVRNELQQIRQSLSRDESLSSRFEELARSAEARWKDLETTLHAHLTKHERWSEEHGTCLVEASVRMNSLESLMVRQDRIAEGLSDILVAQEARLEEASQATRTRVDELAVQVGGHGERLEQAVRSAEARWGNLAHALDVQSDRLEEVTAQLGGQGERLEEAVRSSQARWGDVAGALNDQSARLEKLAAEVGGQGERLALVVSEGGPLGQLTCAVERINRRFSARPYVAKDVFGTTGDLDKPMGYGLDVSALSSGLVTPTRFEEIFRGNQDFIADRQRVYLPFLEGRTNVVDLGCGRGEFLRLIRGVGAHGVGVELDAALVRSCREEGLEVVGVDAFEFLSSLPAGSQDVIFSAQFIEHVESTRLHELLSLARSRLRPGGLLIAETVNPESFEALKVFYVDLTHHRPIYPQVLLYKCHEAGFPSARIFYPLGGGFTQRHYETAGEYAVIALT